jgi:phage baseplate assembly protein W
MTIQRISRSFKDISLSFEPHPVTKDLPILRNENAIKRSVRNIVETIPTDKFFNPNFGTASIIQNQIEISIRNFEPRVDNVNVEVNPKPDTNEFEVTIFFDIIGQEFPTQEFTFILEATR